MREGHQLHTKHAGRQCPACGLECVAGQPDPCIGKLPGVRHACCGHGDRSRSYIQFEDGTRVDGFRVTLKGRDA